MRPWAEVFKPNCSKVVTRVPRLERRLEALHFQLHRIFGTKTGHTWEQRCRVLRLDQAYVHAGVEMPQGQLGDRLFHGSGRQ